MSKNNSPAFQFYPKDILSDENVVLMDLDTVGGYIYLLCYCWLQGSLPAESDSLRKLAHCAPDRWGEMWPQIKPCFRSNGRGRLWHPRLKREKAKQVEWKRKSQEGGIASAKSRRGNELAKGGATNGQPGGARVVQPNANSSSPSSSPSSSLEEKNKNNSVVSPKVKPGQIQEVFDAHLRIRGRYHKNKTGRLPSRQPTLTKAIRDKIARAIREHSFDKAKAAGQGIFLSPFHTGKNDRNTEYLQPSVAWKMPNTAGNGPDNVEIFSELYFNEKARR